MTDRSALLALFTGAALEVSGDVLLKEWADGKRAAWQGLGLYALGSLGWALLLRRTTLSRGLVLFTLANLVLGVLAGALVLGERLTSRDAVGVSLAVLSVLVLEAR